MEALALHIVIPLKPIPQGRARVGRWATYYPKTSQAYRGELVSRLACEERISGPVRIWIQVAGARANSDLSNHQKMVEDALVDAGIIDGDDVRTVREIRSAAIDGPPRTIISIMAVR